MNQTSHSDTKFIQSWDVTMENTGAQLQFAHTVKGFKHPSAAESAHIALPPSRLQNMQLMDI
jgi:hypothetical protein